VGLYIISEHTRRSFLLKNEYDRISVFSFDFCKNGFLHITGKVNWDTDECKEGLNV